MPNSSEISDRLDTCLMACLDVMDHCVDSAAAASAAPCFQQYSQCADDCDRGEGIVKV